MALLRLSLSHLIKTKWLKLIQSYVFKNPTVVQSQHSIQEEPDIDPLSKFREVTNIALGRGAAVISDRIGKFIDLPVPNVGIVEASELNMIIADALHRDSVHAVTQRFVGNGIHGESLVCMRGQDIGGTRACVRLSDERIKPQ